MRWCSTSLLVGVLFLLGAAEPDSGSWQVTAASLWGGAGDEAGEAVAVDAQGVALIGLPSTGLLPTGVPLTDLGKGGLLLRLDTLLGAPLGVTSLPGPVTAVAVAGDGSVFVAAGALFKLDPAGTTVLWSGGPAGRRIFPDATGGAWVWDGGTLTQVGDAGKILASRPAKGRDVAVDVAGGRFFTCGFNAGNSKKSGNPVHVPWIRAYALADGAQQWHMWNFTPTQVDEVSDMADSHPQRLCVGLDGKLYMFGDSDGGNTAYRHDPFILGKDLGPALAGIAFIETWKAFTSCRLLFACCIESASG